LDFFGGIRRQVEALIAQTDYQHLQLEATYITLSSNIVNAAIMEASLREQIAATKTIIATQKQLLTMVKQRLNMGDASIFDIALQEAQLAASEATLPPLQKQLALQRNQLNALVGRLPDDAHTPTFTLDSLHLPTELPLSLPATLLEHRPDIRAAEEQMHAANALIGVAVANRLPNLSLGNMPQGATATDFSKLFTNTSWFWAAIGIVSQPIFDAGTLMFRHRNAKATYEASAALYRLTVINAFQNVSDTLKTIKTDAAALHAANHAEEAALKNLTITRQQLILGDSSAVAVLLSEQIYLQAKLNLIQAQSNRLQDTVALFQALGGGWWNKC
ncbi:MAG: efflux transporter outer membrane subunit, partial [Methylocystaceae bacterium]|nr:efflux transporter outer membrane subunit [Methylocystaceae bacterium]